MVARDAPSTPIFNSQENMKSGSSITFKTTPVITAIEEIFTEDSALAAQLRLCAGKLNNAAMNIQIA